MSSKWWLLFCGWALVNGASQLSADEPEPLWGSIRGQFVVDGPIANPLIAKRGDTTVKDAEICAREDLPDESLVINPQNSGVANIFIWLMKPPEQVHPKLQPLPEPGSLTMERCRFVPHAQTLRATQTLHVKNLDETAHNAHFFSVANTVACGTIPPNDRVGVNVAFPLADSLPIKTTCDIHPWMTCYVLVLNHSYSAVTDADGKYEIPNLPLGEHHFRVWHERQGYLKRDYTVTVTAGKTIDLPVEKIPAEKLQKK